MIQVPSKGKEKRLTYPFILSSAEIKPPITRPRGALDLNKVLNRARRKVMVPRYLRRKVARAVLSEPFRQHAVAIRVHDIRRFDTDPVAQPSVARVVGKTATDRAFPVVEAKVLELEGRECFKDLVLLGWIQWVRVVKREGERDLRRLRPERQCTDRVAFGFGFDRRGALNDRE